MTAGTERGADDGPAPTGDAAAPAARADHDQERRAFFRQFGRQALVTVGQVAGVADMVRSIPSSTAANLLGLGDPASARTTGPAGSTVPRGAALVTSPSSAPGTDDVFRSPYRVSGDELVLLDQRAVPDRVATLVARRGSDVAYYLRLGACRGGAVMAQVAAYGLALTAAERATQPVAALDAELRRTAQALASARPSSRLPAWAMARMETARSKLDAAAEGADVAAALRAEADAIAADIQAAQAAIVAALHGMLAGLATDPSDRPLGVLVHGDPGALSGGLLGTGITALRAVRDEGRDLRVFVSETRPFMDGVRLASWELRQADIDHKVIPDSAVAWLFDRERIDTVLVDADWIAANGDTGAVIGSRAVALQAAATADSPGRPRPKVVVAGLSHAIDPTTPDGHAIPVEMRPARDQAAYLTGLSIRVADALVPASDVMPAETIAALVTERGVLAPPSAAGIASLVDPAILG